MRHPAAILIASLLVGACQTISKAPEGSPRVEVEVAVSVDDGFFGSIEEVGDRKALVERMHGVVLSKADVGLRFYPVSSDDYGRGQDHPPYVMTVEVSELRPEFDHELMEEEGQEPWIHTTVDDLLVTVAARVEKRRGNAPALVVGTATAEAKVGAEGDPDVLAAGPSYVLNQKSGTEEPLRITRDDLLLAVDKAVVKALRQLEEAIDRELAPVEMLTITEDDK